MAERIRGLFPSLVGSSIEYNFKKKFASVTTIDKNISIAKKRIERDITMALCTGGHLCVMLLAELTLFYSKEPYYMAVRSSIEMRRYRTAVLEYMQLDVEERADQLEAVLTKSIRGDKNRDLKIQTLRYFLATYTSRISDFKKLITREEYLLII